MEHRFYAGTIKNGWLYFSDIQFNGLYKTELVSGHTFFIDLFYGAHIQDKKLHRIAIATEDYIFFIPQYSKYFHVLDLKTEKLSILHSKFELEGRFSDAVCLGNRIYLIPMYGTGRLAYIDINQMIIEYDTRFDYFYKKMINDQIVTKRVVRKNDDLLFGLFGTDKIIKFNMENGGFEKFESGVPDINGIYTSNNGFWITSNSERDLFLWNGMKTERYQCNDSYDTNHPVGRYAQVIEFNSNVYAIKNSKHFLYILKDKEFTFVPLSQNYPQKEGYSVDGIICIFSLCPEKHC